MNTLWVVCPVYFDVDSFLTLQARIGDEFTRLDFDAPGRLRLVAIDDSGGQDPEIARLDDLPDVTVLPTPFNLGHQAALVFGLRRLASEMNAEDWVVTLDADGEDQPADFPRLLRELSVLQAAHNHVVLAWRVKRIESLSFKVCHFCFKLMFRLLTGTVTRTGNYAAFRGHLAKQVLFHPYFDLSYSSALLALNLPATFVPCDRGRRYAGKSKMGVSRLIMHGLRMLMPFVDRLTTRALICFGVVFGLGLAGSAVVLLITLLTEWPIPGWMSFTFLSIVTISFTGLINLVILFVVFVQFRSLSMRGLHEKAFGLEEGPANSLGVDNRQLLQTPADALPNYQAVNRNPLALPEEDSLRLSWEEFARLVKHRVRYLRFPPEHTGNDNERVGPADMLDALAHIVARYHLVTTLNAGTRLFRVRIHNPAKVPKNTVAALGPAPVEKARFSNRMSPAGMSMFYGALDETTAEMETFVRHDGNPVAATVATFELVENLRVVDLTKLPDVPIAFASNEADLERPAILFLHAFVDDGFTQPIEKDGREHIDYVPSQVVTEYLRYRLAETIGEPIGGILYPSARKKGGVGCVLFVAHEDIYSNTLRQKVPFQLLSDLTKTIPLAAMKM